MYALAWGAQNLIEPGQARPETIAQSTFTLVVVFFAMATQALIIGQMTTTINRMEASRNAKSAGRQVVDGYLESRDVPRKLRQRIHRFFDFVGSVSDVNAEELLENLPPQLKLQLELYHKRDVYLKNPVFKECRADEVVEIVQRVELLHASEGQYLVQEGHKSPGLYTIIRGSIEVLKGESPAQHGTHLRTRWPGEIFGEASLLGTGQLATASCVAAVMSELMLLRKDAWDDLVRLFPELHSRMERYASDKDRVGEGDAFAKCAQMHRDNADRRCAPSKADPFMV
uniref:Cyclic nucleotide-binding domain-containing protein n=1 Tax=Haptolina ericina TaxID=156174 RepID=A0A7S3EQ84_9EUKA